jgi:hypothetical protein
MRNPPAHSIPQRMRNPRPSARSIPRSAALGANRTEPAEPAEPNRPQTKTGRSESNRTGRNFAKSAENSANSPS